MSTHEFPRYGAGQELTAAHVNALLDQMRRQSRVFTAPPLDARQTPEGWLITLNTPPGFWATVGDRASDGARTWYAYAEAANDRLGRWQEVPGGRRGGVSGGAVEVNGRTDVPPGTVVWMTGTATGDPSGGSAVFSGPPADATEDPVYFWGRLLSQSGGKYEFNRLVYTGLEFVTDARSLGSASEDSLAVEATGRTDATIGSVVLMRVDAGRNYNPVFSVAATAGGFWAKNGYQRTRTELELTRDRFERAGSDDPWPRPVGGTWTMRVVARFSAATIATSEPIPYDATVDEVTAAVEALDIPYGSVAVGGTDGGPWLLTVQNELAERATLSFVTDDLDYGDEPPLAAVYTGVSGRYAGYVYRADTAVGSTDSFTSVTGATAIEVERSEGGSWYYAREPRTASNVQPANPDVTALPGDVLFVEAVEYVPTGAITLSVYEFGDFSMTDDETGDAINIADAADYVKVIPDGQARVILVDGASGTFRIRHQFGVTAVLPHTATAAEVEAAINAGITDETSRVAATGGPLTAGVHIAWADEDRSAPADPVTIYRYTRAYSEPTAWQHTAFGHTRVAPTGHRFDEVWEVRTYHPAGDTPRPTGGTFTLAYGDTETEPIAFDATFQDVQDELEPIAGRGNLYCEGGPLPAPIRVHFCGELAGVETGGLSVVANELTGPEPDEGGGEEEAPPVPLATVFRPASVVIRTHGPVGPDAPSPVNYTLALDDESDDFSPDLDGSALATAVDAAFDALAYRVRCDGGKGGPWRLTFRDTLATEPPELTAEVPGGSYAVSATPGEADGVTAEPDGGTVKLCLGAQWKLEMTGTPSTGATGSTSSRFRLSVAGGTFATVGYGATAAFVAQTLAAISPNTAPSGPSNAPLWVVGGGPLGIAPMFLEVHGWPCHRTLELTASEPTAASPAYSSAGNTVRMTATQRQELGGDAFYVEFATSSPAPVGGTWQLPLGDGFAPPVAPLPYNATASEVQAAIRSWTRTVGNGLPLTFTFQPFPDATASGGPLPEVPIVVRIPTAPSANWRKYGLGIYPSEALFTPGTTLLTPAPRATPTTTAAITWLGTDDLDVTELTAETAEAALRATPYGDLARCTAAADALGGIVLAVPEYDGEPVRGNLASRFSAFGYADGGRLRFYSNAVPFGYEGVVTSNTSEVNHAWWLGFSSTSPYTTQPQRGDPIGRRIVSRPFTARLISTGSPPLGGGSNTHYSWVELRPGPGRTPTDDDPRTFAYNGPFDYTSYSPAISSPGTSLTTEQPSVFAATAITGATSVPRLTEVTLDPATQYTFDWPEARPTPRIGRINYASAYLPGVTTDTYSDFSDMYTAFAPRVLLEADADDPRVNSGRGYPYPTNYTLAPGKYTGAYPDTYERPGVTVNWSIPDQPLESGTVGLVGGGPLAYYNTTPATGASQSQYLGSDFSNSIAGTLGDGDKAVDGTLFLFPPSLNSAGNWNTLLGASLPSNYASTVGARGRSLQVTVEGFSNAGPASVTFGSWGTVGPFVLGSPLAYVQGLVDGLLGANQGRVTYYIQFGTQRGFTFKFAGGDYARRDPGAITTVNCGYTSDNSYPAKDGTADNFETIAYVTEGSYCQAGKGGGGLIYAEGTQGALSPTFGVTYYQTLRQVGFNCYCGASVNVLNHQGGAVFLGGSETGDGGSGVGHVTLETVTGNTQFTEAFRTGSRLILSAMVPMQCGAGRGYHAAVTGSYNAYHTGLIEGVSDGCAFNFIAGLCVFGYGDGTIPSPVTGSFPTADGRVATVVEGYITQVV